ncbi:A-kinase anchor protein 6, partial [Dissostichus eleginoides]
SDLQRGESYACSPKRRQRYKNKNQRVENWLAGLKEILHMVSSQWDHLLRQIRRQHGWMLRALRCIQARVLYTGQSHEPSGEPSANREAACPSDGLKSGYPPVSQP